MVSRLLEQVGQSALLLPHSKTSKPSCKCKQARVIKSIPGLFTVLEKSSEFSKLCWRDIEYFADYRLEDHWACIEASLALCCSGVALVLCLLRTNGFYDDSSPIGQIWINLWPISWLGTYLLCFRIWRLRLIDQAVACQVMSSGSLLYQRTQSRTALWLIPSRSQNIHQLLIALRWCGEKEGRKHSTRGSFPLSCEL